jgi:hypothetical protein
VAYKVAEPITLRPETLKTLGGVLSEIVRDLEHVHRRMFNNLRTQWKWYWAEPATPKKNFPWPNASNVVPPVIMTQADARTAQDFSLLYSSKDRMFGGRSENEDFAANYLGEVLRFLNWGVDAEVKPFWTLLDWIHERNVVGGSVFSVTYESKERWMLLPGQKRPQRVMLSCCPKWTHWPAEKILWEPNQSIRESDCVITQRLLNWGAIATMMQTAADSAPYIEENVLALRKFPHVHGSEGAQIQADKEQRAGIDSAQSISRRAVYDWRTLWIDWPALAGMGIPGLQDAAVVQDDETGDRVRVPLIVELAPDAELVMRILPNPYLAADGNCFFDAYYQRQVGYPRGVGIAKRCEQPQRAQATVVNQAFDGRTSQLAMPFKTTNAKLKERPITPGQGVYVDAMGDIEAFAIPGAGPIDLALANFMQVMAERAGGSNDPSIGRESRSGGHPSPATNYMGQLQQSAKMGAPATLILGETLASAGVYTASLYQQYDTDENNRISRVFGEGDAAKIREWLFPRDMAMAGNLQLSLTALSDDNPQAAIQKAMMTSQVTQMYFGNILKLMQVLSSPQVPPQVKQAGVQAIKVLGNTHRAFLEASDYDEAQEAIFQLEQGEQGGLDKLRELVGGLLPAGASGGAGQGAGMPGEPGPIALPGAPQNGAYPGLPGAAQ